MSDTAEQLTVRVLSALLREDVAGLRSRGRLTHRADGPWLVLADERIALPVEPDGFQCELRARLPLLAVDGEPRGELPAILEAFRALANPMDATGFTEFTEECRQTLATMLLHERHLPIVLGELVDCYGDDPADWEGPLASLGFDTLAAHLDHPVYPTARGRAGLGIDDLLRHAPECHPPSSCAGWHCRARRSPCTAAPRCPIGGRRRPCSACRNWAEAISPSPSTRCRSAHHWPRRCGPPG